MDAKEAHTLTKEVDMDSNSKSVELEERANSPDLIDREGDYSGAVAKTNEAEIALCRKLDRRILPILWAMYYL
jgi:hypothetical protein